MSDLEIHKKNEVYIKVLCERHIAQELSEWFTFYVPGYKFVPSYRNKIWDGKIRLFSLQTNQIYRGLLPYIQSFCEERNYSLDTNDIDIEDEFSLYQAKNFYESLNLHSKGQPIVANEHQLEAFVHGMQAKRMLLISPTSSGKSLIAYTIFRQLSNNKQLKGLIIVPTTSLVEQLFSDFCDYSSHNDFDVEENVHRIYQGKEKHTDKSLTISTWQSLFKMPKEYFEQFDYIIGDEAHNFKSQSLTTIMTSCINTKYRIGMTGTLDGTKTHRLVLEGLFGTAKQFITTKQLMDQGVVSDFEIKCLVLKHNEETCKLMKDCNYQDEINYLISNEQRNKLIRNLTLSLGTNTLILYQMVEKHGKILYNLITQTEKIGNRKVFFVHGGTDTSDREKIRKIMEEESDAIVIASFGTFSTGINIRNLHNIIFASPSKSRVRNLQSIGRGLRKSDKKSKACLYDIADDLRYKKHMNFTLKHFIERVKLYTEEKFTFKIYKIELKK